MLPLLQVVVVLWATTFSSATGYGDGDGLREQLLHGQSQLEANQIDAALATYTAATRAAPRDFIIVLSRQRGVISLR